MTEQVQIDGSKPTRYSLLFSVKRSIRYHDHRQAFFTSFGNWTSFITVILGTASVAVLLIEFSESRVWLLVLPFFVSLLNGIVLVFRISTKSRDHWDLRNAFIELEKKVVLLAEDDTETLLELHQERLNIESREPAILDILNIRCHNEVCRVLGRDEEELYSISWLQRRFSPFFDYKLEETLSRTR